MRSLINKISLEPAIPFFTVTFGLSVVVGQNLVTEKCCRELGFTEDVCSDINHHIKENEIVQKKVNVVMMWTSILTAIPSIVLVLFVGPWSDKNGRKPILVLPSVGIILSQFIWMLNVYFMDASVYFLLFTSVSALFGGFTCFLIGIFSYISDITNVRERTSRLAIIDFFLFIGFPTGTFLSGLIFKHLGYYGIFGSVAVCQLVCMLYILMFVKESIEVDTENQLTLSSSWNLGSILNWRLVNEVFEATFRKRQHKMRRVILILIFCMLMNVTGLSEGSIVYNYTRKVFFWTEQEFTRYLTFVVSFSGAASLIMMPLLSYVFRVHDAMIAIIACMSKISSLVVTTIAADGYTFIFASCLGCIGLLAGTAIRSMLSKSVPPGELGKIYSLLGSLEAAVPLFMAPLFTTVYNSTIEYFPAAVFIVMTALFTVNLVLFSYVFYVLTKTGQDFTELVTPPHSSEDASESSPLLSRRHENTLYT